MMCLIWSRPLAAGAECLRPRRASQPESTDRTAVLDCSSRVLDASVDAYAGVGLRVWLAVHVASRVSAPPSSAPSLSYVR